jgi:hypothetical protein
MSNKEPCVNLPSDVRLQRPIHLPHEIQGEVARRRLGRQAMRCEYVHCSKFERPKS